MKNIKIITIFSLLVIPLYFASMVSASGSVSLNPSGGTIGGQGISIDLVVDTGGSEVDGIQMTLDYEGDIEFIDIEPGDIPGCDADGVERDTEEFDDIFLYCFILGEPYKGSGVFATLNFEPTGEGSANINILTIDGVSASIGEVGSYTTTMSESEPEESSGSEEEERSITPPQDSTAPLPRTSIYNTFFVSLGFVFISIPLILKSHSFSNKKDLMSKKVN